MEAKKKLRLLITTNTIATFGGGEKLAFDMRNLLKDKFDVTFTNPISKVDLIRDDPNKLLKQFGIPKKDVYDVKCIGIKRKAYGVEEYVLMIPTLGGLANLAKAVKNSDAIYGMSNNPFLLLFTVLYAKLYGSKFVFGVQQPLFARLFEDKGIPVALYRFVLGQIKYYHVLNTYEQGLVNKDFPNAVTYLIPGFIKSNLNKPKMNNEFVVMFTGRHTKYEKGIDLLCDIIEKTIKKNKTIKFKIGGAKGDGEELVKKLAAKYPQNVKALGFVSAVQVRKEWASSSLALLTSRNEELRYFPLVFVESQSFGLPLITFKGEGYYSILIDDVQGRMIKKYDTDAASDAIIEYYNMFKRSKKDYFKMKQRVAAVNKKLFGEKTIIPQMIRMFTD